MSICSVILPVYNEVNGIAVVIDGLRNLPFSCDIIAVDDGSTDGTRQIIEQKGVKLISHPANAGYGRSLKDGILAAENDIIVITDADGSYPIEAIASLLQALEQGFDMAVGARQGHQDSFLKAPARLLFKFLVEFTTGKKIPDINSGLRAFRKSQVLPYFADLCEGFSFTTTITLIYMLTGKFVKYLPIEYKHRIGRSKVRMIRDSLRTLQYIVETIAAYNPLKLFILLAGLLGLVGLGLGIVAAVLQLAYLVTPVAVFFISSCIVFAMGVQSDAQRKAVSHSVSV